MKIKIFFLLFLLLISFTLISSAQEVTSSKINPISTFLEKTISNPSLKFIGINETVSMKYLLVVVLLILITVIVIYNAISFSELTQNKSTNIAIAVIISLIGSYTGLPLKATKQIAATPEQFVTFIKSPSFLIGVGVIILLVIFSPYIKKMLKKAKEDAEKEKLQDKNSKFQKLAKIEEFETDLKLKRYGIDPKE